jgi:hypothetical protein
MTCEWFNLRDSEEGGLDGFDTATNWNLRAIFEDQLPKPDNGYVWLSRAFDFPNKISEDVGIEKIRVVICGRNLDLSARSLPRRILTRLGFGQSFPLDILTRPRLGFCQHLPLGIVQYTPVIRVRRAYVQAHA